MNEDIDFDRIRKEADNAIDDCGRALHEAYGELMQIKDEITKLEKRENELKTFIINNQGYKTYSLNGYNYTIRKTPKIVMSPDIREKEMKRLLQNEDKAVAKLNACQDGETWKESSSTLIITVDNNYWNRCRQQLKNTDVKEDEKFDEKEVLF